MLKKIQIRIVAVIMSIVTLILGAVFTGVMHFTHQNIERESIRMMEGIMFQPEIPFPAESPENETKKLRIPFFSLDLDSNGSITAKGGDFFDLSDEELLEEIADTAFSSDNNTGVIYDYSLRFMKNENRIVFADISGEKMMLGELTKTAVSIGLAALLLFFFISIILSKWLTKPVEKAWDEQKQFIADASHELKTPLTVIMTNAEMLSDFGYSEAEKKNFTNNILSMSRRMRGLVESLLQLARMDKSSEEIIFADTDLSKLVSDGVLPFEPLFFEKNMIIETKIEKNIHIFGDKNKLRQVIDILLDNALKYSDDDAPVTVRLNSCSSGCILSVSGKGTPLSSSECRDIFRRFYRADKSRNDGESYGLGLSIAESIISGHGGKIHAESTNCINSFCVQFDTKKTNRFPCLK